MADALRIQTDVSSADVQALRDRINAFNFASVGGLEGEDVGVFVRGADGELQGGLYGWTWGGYLEISLLWVHEAERGRGLGSRLLALAEAEGRKRGAHTAILDTHTFQAPDFYRRHGYEVYATIPGYPAGHDKLFFRKPLLPEPSPTERTDESA